MYAPAMEWFAWLDFETTGPDPRLDHVLEVALVVTSHDLIEQTAFTIIVNPSLDGNAGWEDRLDDERKVRYENNGLLRDITTGVSLRSAEDALVQTIKRVTADPLVLAGVHPEQERAIAQARMRSMRPWMHWRSLDLTSVRRFIRDIGGRTDLIPTFADADRVHRALEDAQDAISEARVYRTYLDIIPED